VLLDAVRCDFLGLGVFCFWRWVGFCFWHFVEFCQFVPLPILEFLNFGADWFIVQLETSATLIFYFSKALGFGVVLALVFFWCFVSLFLTFSHIPTFWETVKLFIFCQTFFDIRLAFSIHFFIN
jgi:hypothetical protein